MIKRVEWSTFIAIAEQCEYIICVGAGKRLQRMTEILTEDHLLRKIRYIVDNDVDKQGTEVVIDEHKVIIQSVQDILPLLKPNVVVVITCLVYEDILRQIECYEEFKRVDVYSLTYILADYCDEISMNKTIPANLKLSENMLIPKIIHYCWFGKNPMPDKNKEWMKSWKKFCPDYEIIEWNENNYDISKNQYMLQAYKQKKWGFVPDYARLDIIYKYGGIYLDTDVELIRNIDDLLYQKGFAGFESNQFVALGLGFGAAPGNAMIKGMMESYDNCYFLDYNGKLNLTPSPVIQTNYLVKKGLKLNGEYQVLNNELTIYPEKMLSGKSVTSKRIKLAPYTCAIHHYDGSWLDEERRNIIEQVEKEMSLE